MSETNLFKLLEVSVLILALAVFVWWQMRDLKQARQATARQRALESPAAGEGHLPDPSELPRNAPPR